MKYGYTYIPQGQESKDDAMIKALSCWWMHLIEHKANIEKFTVKWVLIPGPAHWEIMGDGE